MKVALTVAGSDSGAGAGIQADLFAFAANGVYGTSAIAALTAQNPDGVRSIQASEPSFLRDQLEAVCEYYRPSAAKCGMLFNAELIEVAADFFEKNRSIKLVVDPVMISTSGAVLLKPDAVETLLARLAPLADLITPNLDEAAYILKCEKIALSEMDARASELSEMLRAPVLLKGGHLENSEELADVLAHSGKLRRYVSERLRGVNSHGSGCTLSAAIAARLALGEPLEAACEKARAYLFDGLKNPIKLERDSFINHFI